MEWGGFVGLINVKGNVDEHFLKGEAGEVVVLGDSYPGVNDKLFEALVKQPWFSYRKGFQLSGCQASPKRFTSDVGWGCVHRCGQMLLISSLSRHLGMPAGALLPYFMDLCSSPFSIQSIATEGVKHGTKVGEWFAPSTIAKVLAALVKRENEADTSLFKSRPLDVVVAEQSVLYPEALSDKVAETKGGILLLIPVRLGLDEVDAMYHNTVRSCLKSKLSMGIIGGRPKHSLYFIGYRGRQLIFNDPHKVQPAFLSADSCGATSDPHRHSVPISEIDPSCLISFYLSSSEDVGWLTAYLTELQQGSKFPFLSLCPGAPPSEHDHVETDCAMTAEGDREDNEGRSDGEDDDEYVML